MIPMPLLPLARRVTGPFIFLLTLGAAIALADYWVTHCLPRPRTSTTGRRG